MFLKKVVSILVICIVAQSALAEESKPTENVLNELSWSCANNATCVARVARDVMQKVKNGKPLDFGAFAVEPVEHIPLTIEGRSSRALDFFSSNALKFPIGPMVVNIERSADYPNFIEVSLLRKADGEFCPSRGWLTVTVIDPIVFCLLFRSTHRSTRQNPQAHALLRASIPGLQPNRLVCARHRRGQAARD